MFTGTNAGLKNSIQSFPAEGEAMNSLMKSLGTPFMRASETSGVVL